MAYSIHWMRRAASDIENIYLFYREKANKDVALRRLQRIKRDISHLKSMPYIGPLEEDYHHTPTYRYLTVLDYRIYYFVEDEAVYIAAIWDCRQGGRVFEDNSY